MTAGNPADFDRLWDDNNPAETEARFQKALVCRYEELAECLARIQGDAAAQPFFALAGGASTGAPGAAETAWDW